MGILPASLATRRFRVFCDFCETSTKSKLSRARRPRPWLRGVSAFSAISARTYHREKGSFLQITERNFHKQPNKIASNHRKFPRFLRFLRDLYEDEAAFGLRIFPRFLRFLRDLYEVKIIAGETPTSLPTKISAFSAI